MTKILASRTTEEYVEIKLANGTEFRFIMCNDGRIRIDSSFCDIQNVQQVALNIAEVNYIESIT